MPNTDLDSLPAPLASTTCEKGRAVALSYELVAQILRHAFRGTLLRRQNHRARAEGSRRVPDVKSDQVASVIVVYVPLLVVQRVEWRATASTTDKAARGAVADFSSLKQRHSASSRRQKQPSRRQPAVANEGGSPASERVVREGATGACCGNVTTRAVLQHRYWYLPGLRRW